MKKKVLSRSFATQPHAKTFMSGLSNTTQKSHPFLPIFSSLCHPPTFHPLLINALHQPTEAPEKTMHHLCLEALAVDNTRTRLVVLLL